MRRVTKSEFDLHLVEMLGKSAALAKEYAERFSEMPVATQLAIMRRRRWLSQKAVAKALGAKQPHVARVESAHHDPRLSSVLSQARALHCRLMIVPDECLRQVARIVAGGPLAQGSRQGLAGEPPHR
ncbi:MAG: helix-turn-helix domain-containing protein [Elusimicrobia bacterium]|nr:helix-turn-helix domain-containing protein [Elusimicrobiota bacterium]